jgi:NAD(P)H-nitrite reductase large subunit
VSVRSLCLQFTHVTRFLGRKVVLLGLYNGQKLQQQQSADVVMYSRVLGEGTPAATFVRVLLLRGKMQGAVLIGETDLEETFENLILDGLDLSQYGPDLLDPDIELDHVFD